MIDTKLSDPEVESEPSKADAAPMQQRTESRQMQAPKGSAPAESGGLGSEPATEEIAALAYQLWIERGSPHGSHEEDWYRAEEQLRGGLTRAASV